MSQLGQIGLPHTHLPIRSDSKHLKQVNSILDLYSIDDGLIRALSGIIYGGFETYQLEAAHHDLSMMYSRDTFGQVYQRLLANSSCNLYDPSFSLALFPDQIPQPLGNFRVVFVVVSDHAITTKSLRFRITMRQKLVQ